MKQVSPKHTGGPVYPGPVHDVYRLDDGQSVLVYSAGKTLRDEFAGLAMQAVIARGDDTNRPGIADWSYAMADAMLCAREDK